MNREEAIRKVEGCLTDYFPIEDYGEVEEIIKALKQESCEDAISRKAMLDYQWYLHGRMSNEENYKLWKFIKDLPSVMLTTEPCEDAVSREAVLAIAGDSCLDLDSYEDTKEFCDEIKELPSVVYTQKTGRWIFVDNAHEHAHCSECDYGNVDLLDGRPHNYCPNCGSFMISEDELSMTHD